MPPKPAGHTEHAKARKVGRPEISGCAPPNCQAWPSITLPLKPTWAVRTPSPRPLGGEGQGEGECQPDIPLASPPPANRISATREYRLPSDDISLRIISTPSTVHSPNTRPDIFSATSLNLLDSSGRMLFTRANVKCPVKCSSASSVVNGPAAALTAACNSANSPPALPTPAQITRGDRACGKNPIPSAFTPKPGRDSHAFLIAPVNSSTCSIRTLPKNRSVKCICSGRTHLTTPIPTAPRNSPCARLNSSRASAFIATATNNRTAPLFDSESIPVPDHGPGLPQN